MPDDVIAASSAATTQADSSPAPENHQEVLNNLSPEQRSEWRMTGKLPEKQSEVKTKSSDTAPVKDAETSAAASEAAPQEKHRDNAATRLQEILADLKNAGLSPAELKTFKREAQKQTPAESSPAKPPEKAAPVTTLEAPKEPSIEDPKYTGEDGWKQYEADVRKFNRELASYEAKKAVEDYKREQLQKQQIDMVQKEFAAAETKYADYKDKTQPLIDALIADMNAAPEAKTIHPIVIDAIGSNPLCADILYVIGPQKDEFLQLARTNPLAAMEKVAVIKHLISEEFAAKATSSDKTRDEKGQFQATPEKKVTGAPPPPKEVGGTAAAPGDKVQESVQKRDFASYRAEMNRREMAAKRS